MTRRAHSSIFSRPPPPPPPPPPSPTDSRHLAQLLKEHCLVEGGELQVASWIRDEGYDAPIPAVLAALEATAAGDLLFWAGRYNLFVLWSSDRAHPWDALPASGRHVTLEIGKLRGTDAQPVVLLDGVPVTDYTFSNATLRTTSPLGWATPDGGSARVTLELGFSSYFGYGGKDTAGAYLGLQCHGIMWPAAGPASVPAAWPIAPPAVAGKVNVAGRSAAVAPGASDSLAAFVGCYATHILPLEAGGPSTPGPELSVTVNPQGRPVVCVGGTPASSWTFDASNVLAWTDEAGSSAWLQFMVLPAGPACMGALTPAGEAAGLNVFGELRSQASRLPPDAALDPAVGRMVATGLARSATLLTGRLLAGAAQTWDRLKAGESADDIMAASSDGLLHGMQADFGTLDRIHAVGSVAEALFGGLAGSAASAAELAPAATADAAAGEGEAAEAAAAARVAADAAAAAAAETEEAGTGGNAMEATNKAAVAAWRAAQAAAAAAAAEAAALEAGRHARTAATIAAQVAASSAAQAYNAARAAACDASRAEARAAAAALRAVEQGIALYAERRDYLKLKEIAEASDVAGKALASARDAVEGWTAGSVAGRVSALEAAKTAADAAQLCHKFMRSVSKA